MPAPSLDGEAAAMMGIDIDRATSSVFFAARRWPARQASCSGSASRRTSSLGFVAGLKGLYRRRHRRDSAAIRGAMLGGGILGFAESVRSTVYRELFHCEPLTFAEPTSSSSPDPDPVNAVPLVGPARPGGTSRGCRPGERPGRPSIRKRTSRAAVTSLAIGHTSGSRARSSAAAAAGSPAAGDWIGRRGWAWRPVPRRRRACCRTSSSSGYIIYVGVDAVVYTLLALGLNIVVGWGGRLDLGFVAFYGFGAYAYAIRTSDEFNLHLRRSWRPRSWWSIGPVFGPADRAAVGRRIGDSSRSSRSSSSSRS